jgi:hypothetical protein
VFSREVFGPHQEHIDLSPRAAADVKEMFTLDEQCEGSNLTILNIANPALCFN